MTAPGKRRAGRGRPGFTLLELLAALVLASVLTGSLFAALQIGLLARRTGREALEPDRLYGLVFEALGRDLQCAPPPRGILAGPFSGGASEVTFFTRPMRTPGNARGIVRVSYALDDGEGAGGAVLLRRLTENLLALEEPEPQEEMLARGVESLSFLYFDGLGWLDDWDSVTMADTLPRAVEITLRLRGQGRPGMEPAFHEHRRVIVIPASEAVPLQVEDGTEAEFDE